MLQKQLREDFGLLNTGRKKMNKVLEQTSMNINGGCTVIARSTSSDPDLVFASRPGVAGIEWYCETPKHWLVHIYDGIAYDYRQGDGRRYICYNKKCLP